MSNKIKVLYAEDEQDIRENIAEILKDEGFEVFEASNGKEAVEVFLENNPDVVVSDIMMPEVSGYDLLKIIRENKNIPNNNVPFIFLTALGQKEDVVKGIDLKANDYLTKPIDFDLLIAKIKEKFSNYRQLENSHKESIKGLKNQVSGILPNELVKYLNQIKIISQNLKSEPYGPFPHRKYMENINQIYMSAIKMQSIIDDFVSGEVIDNQINLGEDVVYPGSLITDFIASIDISLKSKIKLHNSANLAQIKINKKLVLEVIRKIFGSIFKIDTNSKIDVSIIEDHLDQMIFIFYPDSKNVNEVSLNNLINKQKINDQIEKYGYAIDLVFKEDESSILFYIPSYRIIRKD